MKRLLHHLFLLIIPLIFVVACQNETAVSDPVTPSPPALPAATVPPSPTATSPPPPAPTSPPTSETTPAAIPTEETSSASPSATVVAPTAGPQAADVAQPPYAESECSDRFPCNEDVVAWEARIQVPPGFTANYFAYLPSPDDPERPLLLTSLTFGPDGLLYVAGAQGAIYTIDAAGAIALFFEGLTVPTGIAFQPGTNRLYVSNRVTDTNVNGEGQVSVIANGQMTQVIGGLPCCYIGMHGPNGIAFGPNGYGYVGVGGRADHGEVLDGSNSQDERHPLEASILRFAPDGSLVETYARGLRNPYDIAWRSDGQLFATDNGRDEDASVGERVPDELHQIVPGGEHGYPFYECPKCFGIPDGVEMVAPFYEFEPHSVPTGIVAYQAEQFPGYYDSLFVTLWTALPFAERVLRLTPDGTASTFATGFATPMDVAVGPQGSLYVADYATGIIFKISYQ